jgi:hypothetical protein
VVSFFADESYLGVFYNYAGYQYKPLVLCRSDSFAGCEAKREPLRKNPDRGAYRKGEKLTLEYPEPDESEL